MSSPVFHIVDVFAESAYQGNPLAVVVYSDPIPDEIMQKIALETNYSETTFVNLAGNETNQFHARIFTPSKEIAFAGHPILGTAWILRNYVSTRKLNQLFLNIGVGRIAVRFGLTPDNEEAVWFRAPPVSFGETCDPEKIAEALGLSKDDIDANFPVQHVTANTSAMIVPLCSLDALQRSKLNLDAYKPLAERGFPPLTYLFCRQTYHDYNDLCARFFFDAHGVREDPATGNGAAFLGYYLLKYRYFGNSRISLRIEQGYQVRRPSLILLHAKEDDDGPEIDIGGTVVPVVRGELVY